MAMVHTRRFAASALLLGFALGGFFDGILLHQVLQWHHLLSALDGGVLGDVRGQVMADGLFHVGMYVLALVALRLLWDVRGELARPGARQRLVATVLLGFGGWHVVDAVLSHWVLGLHRIRMDTASPLAWDLAWLGVFGLLPLAVGWWMRRRSSDAAGGGPAAAALLAAVTVVAGLQAADPWRTADERTVTVVLRPGASAAGLLAALDGSDARVVGSDPRGHVWVLALDRGVDPFALYRRGALYVSGTLAPTGCFGRIRA
jgi:uncharacterized membrane protein